MTREKPTVLLTNDDGPPDSTISPFIYDFAQALRDSLGWTVLVVVPSSQKSWIGKAYFIASTVDLHYFYPEQPDGFAGDKLETARPLRDKDEQQWILLDGTPSTCSNIALHNLYPGQIDLVISGPNFGRNTTSAFALSSGTIGAAMAASLSSVPSIALSYGVFQKPVAPEITKQAHRMSCSIISKLWQEGFLHNRNEADGQVDIYSINVPLVPSLLEDDASRPEARLTEMATTRYQRLFAHVRDGDSRSQELKKAGPDAASESSDSGNVSTSSYAPRLGEKMQFKFQPDIGQLLHPDPKSLLDGTDIHALQSGHISITPLRAAFASAPLPTQLAKAVGEGGQLSFEARL